MEKNSSIMRQRSKTMKTLSTAETVELLKTAQFAKGDVWFTTAEGDKLNLKSLLCKYVFLAAADDPKSGMFSRGKIVCDVESDYDLLRDYME